MRLPRAFSAGKSGAVLPILIANLVLAYSAGAPVFAHNSKLDSGFVSTNLEPRPPANVQPDPNRLAQELFLNEVQAEIQDQSLWCFREMNEEHGQKKLFDACQSKDGEMDRLLELNGEPLTRSQRQAEDQRLQKLVNHPDQLLKQQRKDQEDSKQAHDLMRMFPDAFRFQYEGMQGNLMELKFSPNPGFHASGHAAQVFHQLEGSVLFDPEQKRLAEISGQLTSDVKFGWGLLGHLDKGGTFFVKQQDVGSGHWETVDLDVQMSGKALFFKTISVRQRQISSDFRQQPDDTTPLQAWENLLRDPAPR